VAFVAVTALVAVACGNGSKKSSTATTATTAASESTTSPAESSTTVAGETTTTAAAAGQVGATTTTTAKKTATTSKSNIVTKATAAPPKVGGIAQVTTTASTAPSEPPQAGGTFTALLAAEGNGFDPSFSTGSIGGTDPLKLFAVYDALVYADGASGGVVPQTAASMTTADAITWNLKIRPGIKFTDGTAYDAAAVKYNWDRCANDASLACSQAPTLKTWKYDVAAGDPLTLAITLPSPNGQFPRIISIGSGGLSAVASPTWLKAAGSRDNVLNQKPVGAGPFTLEQWTKDSSISFVRNPNYWNSPKPYLDRLVFKPVTDEQQRVNSFKVGEANAIYLTNPTFIPDLQKNFPIASVPSINSSIMEINVKHAPFNDPNIRKAIYMAIDLDQLNKTIFGGALETPKGFFPSNLPYSDPSLQFPGVDLTKAQALVDDWIANKNGGKDLVFTWTCSNSGVTPAVAQLVQQMVQRLKHVTMNLNVESVVQNTNDIRSGNFDIVGTVITGVDPEPQFFQTVQTNGTRQQAAGYSNPSVDKAIADSRAALDPNARIAALKNLQGLLLQDMPDYVMYRQPAFWPSQPNVRDLSFFDEGGLLSDRVWIKTH
jgi:peptide/nickel transport system substrate-binding protein